MSDALAILRQGRRRRWRRRLLVTGILVALALVLAAALLMLGNTIYPAQDVFRVIMGEKVTGASFAVGTLRLPRMIAAVLAGLAFGAAGAAFQTMLRNPLASPDIIGINSGCSAAAVTCILLFNMSGAAVSAISVLAGLAVAALIYLLAYGREGASGRLILMGIGVGALMDAVVSYMLLKGSEYDIPAAYRWLTGSLNAMRMDEMGSLAIAVAILLPLALVLARSLEAVELGDETAHALGARVERTRILLILCAVGLVAFATATTGPIAFVAFLSGPIASRLVGTGKPHILQAALVGAALVLAADLLGQFAFDTRFPVGVITGILGAPYLLVLLIRLNRKGSSL
ncbi:MAG: iron chelate uptake ABC transporter family permease subunit [Coriobacteriales bacterium]|jgi:iron complex transport system permease protein|nr:iron chelate uptake ABC transporter family permease subunit [Coriobacteriales bacterium]